MSKAAELGGGDELWATRSASDASWFAKANPAGGDPALLRITVPNSVMDSLESSSLLRVEGSVYKFQPGAINTLNNNAITQLVR